QLWPDSVVPILDGDAYWYRVARGYVPRFGLQPMMLSRATPTVHLPEESFWAEVGGPVAVVRQHCAADAPLITRIGHGGTAYVTSSLLDDSSGMVWYAISSEQGGEHLGWTQAQVWQPVTLTPIRGGDTEIVINVAAQALMAMENGSALMQAPISTSEDIPRGTFSLAWRRVGSTLSQSSGETLYGVPWRIGLGVEGDRFASLEIVGAYWHNFFGMPHQSRRILEPEAGTSSPNASNSEDDMTIQVSPLVARWLFQWLGVDGFGRVIIE
ncbi:MAG: L,D-transpeptidase, partial [Burkholderiales bacterium]|nr:L,D-transpeptidase [Anaerolineae bacterium]